MLGFKEPQFNKESAVVDKDKEKDRDRMFRRFLLVEQGDSAVKGVQDHEN